MKRSAKVGWGMAALLGLLGGGYVEWSRREKAETVEASRLRIEVEVADPVRGPADAAVTIVEFCNFEAPDCRAIAPVLARVLKDFAPDVRLVFKDYTQHGYPRGQVAAHLARHVYAQQGNDAFWKAHDKVFEVLSGLEEPVATTLSAALGLEWDKISDAVNSETVARPLRANLALASASGVSAVPFLFVNGRPMAGPHSFEGLSELLREELERARPLVAKAGKGQRYAEVTKGARVPKPDPALLARPTTKAERQEAEYREKQAEQARAAAAAQDAGAPQAPPNGVMLAPLPAPAGPAKKLTLASLTDRELQALKAKGMDPQAFVDFANASNDARRQEEALRADRRAKGLPGGSP